MQWKAWCVSCMRIDIFICSSESERKEEEEEEVDSGIRVLCEV